MLNSKLKVGLVGYPDKEAINLMMGADFLNLFTIVGVCYASSVSCLSDAVFVKNMVVYPDWQSLVTASIVDVVIVSSGSYPSVWVENLCHKHQKLCVSDKLLFQSFEVLSACVISAKKTGVECHSSSIQQMVAKELLSLHHMYARKYARNQD